jgi:hypothetical protein
MEDGTTEAILEMFPNIDISKYKHKRLTDKQIAFLNAYMELLNINRACDAAGVQYTNLVTNQFRDTLFNAVFRELRSRVEKDLRFDKSSVFERLCRYRDTAEKNGDLKLALEIQKEMNKMTTGMMAPTTQIERKEQKVEVKVLDFTKRGTQALEQNNTISLDNYQKPEAINISREIVTETEYEVIENGD